MVEIEEMKSYIQEWMAQPLSVIELARLYSKLKLELEKQLEVCMESLTGEKT